MLEGVWGRAGVDEARSVVVLVSLGADVEAEALGLSLGDIVEGGYL